MPAILLTPKNVEFAKRRLRLRFPDVKSSHHTEALAAGLGFRTHAALLTQLKWHEDTRAVIARASGVKSESGDSLFLRCVIPWAEEVAHGKAYFD